MNTWTVHWTQEGYVEIDAETKEEAVEKFNAMSPVEVREMGDSEHMQAYHIAEADV